MAFFIGSNFNDRITPGFVSPEVFLDGGVRPGQGPDFIDGGDGDDTIDGGLGGAVNTLIGGEGDDTLLWNSGGGSDIMDGDVGFDTLVMKGSDTSEIFTVSANAGHVVVQRNVAGITLDVDNMERVAIETLRGTDTVVINSIARTELNEVVLDLGDGTGHGDGQIDTVVINGGARADNYFVSIFDGNLNDITNEGQARTVLMGADDNDRLVFNAGDGDDRFSGVSCPADITVNGDAGNDTLVGSSSGDTLNGGIGADSIDGSLGNDRVNGGDGDDQLGFSGLFGQSGGQDTIEGGAGLDTLAALVDGGARLEALRGRALLTTSDGAVADTNDVERLFLQLGDDDATNVLFVGDLSGTEVKEVTVDFGLQGVPDHAPDGVTVTGTVASDRVVVVSGPGGSILISGLPATVRILNTSGLDSVSLETGAGHDFVDASGVTSRITRIVGDGGNDTLVAGQHESSLAGRLGDDLLIGGAQHNQLEGGEGADTLSGGVARDVMYAGSGNDSLAGGDGSDMLVGEDGSDTLVGGDGADTFFFSASPVFGQDQIRDFVTHGTGVVHDVIQLLGFADLSLADLKANGHIFDTATGVAISDGDHVFATLLGVKLASLNESDFIFGWG